MNLIKQVKWLICVFMLLHLGSCKKDDARITKKDPSIEFSASTGEYKVKVGKTVTLHALVADASRAVYSWKLNGEIVSNDSIYVFKSEKIGEYFVTFRVDAENGSVEKQVKVSVLAKLAPAINMPGSYIAWSGIDTRLVAKAENADSAEFIWRLNGNIVSTDSVYIFNQTTLGLNQVTLKVITADGEDLKPISVIVLPPQGPELYFDNGRYRVTSNVEDLRKMTVPLGKTLVLSPVIAHIPSVTSFQWTIDGAVQSSTNEYLNFTPTAKGTYLITVKENSSSATAQVQIECTEPEGTYFRPIAAGSKASAKTAFDFVPAPGQFINYQIGYTKTRALQDLQNALDAESANYIGAYGGYWIVGFDHSVKNEIGKADIRIDGNAFAGWSEPGIVWVMQDENGNGEPDDTWYELKGSESGKPETKPRYAITYFKPTAPGSDVVWIDNNGKTGSVDYNGYHTQPYYFPMFIAESSYTLTGTCLASTFETGTIETNAGYPWGYVDNYGDGSKLHFWIEDAIQADGSPANLQHIDFVKVHTAMVAKGSAVGEVSTEAGVPIDLNFNQ